MSLTPTPGSLLYFGIGKEVTAGTAVDPTYFVDASKVTTEDLNKIIDDESYYGDRAKTHQSAPGVLSSKIDITCPLKMDTVGFFLSAALGPEDFIVGPPINHLFALTVGQPNTYTITVVYGGARVAQFTNCMATDVEVAGTSVEKAVEVTSSFVGNSSSIVAAPTATWTAEPITPDWATTVSVGPVGSLTPAYAESWSVAIKADVKALYAAIGSRNPAAFMAVTVDVTGKLTCLANGASAAELTHFTNGDPRYFAFSIAPYGAGSSELLLIEVLTAVYKTGKPVASLTDAIKYDFTFGSNAASTTFANAGLMSPVQITLTNSVPTGNY